MDLNTVWFVLIAVLFIGYFLLEGFDFGVGILMPFLGKDDVDRRVVINTIGPFWDANEVWLITAGGAMFAAFPHWYATLFSGFYLALFLILIALIVRAVGFEFRAKGRTPRWRAACDAGIFVGSAVPALLWGVALTNVIQGVPIDANKHYTGTFFTLLNAHALLGGGVSLLVFTLHGASFLALRTEGDLQAQARRCARRLWWPAAIVTAAFALYGYTQTTFLHRYGVVPGTLPLLAIAGFAAMYVFIELGYDGWAFGATGFTVVSGAVVAFEGLFPRVMPSTLNPAWDLTIYNASSSRLTLIVMLVVALLFVPLVLAYQGWSYWVFRQRVTRQAIVGPPVEGLRQPTG
jgi:cytochrome bd ubiquinol oxidase subunit II